MSYGSVVKMILPDVSKLMEYYPKDHSAELKNSMYPTTRYPCAQGYPSALTADNVFIIFLALIAYFGSLTYSLIANDVHPFAGLLLVGFPLIAVLSPRSIIWLILITSAIYPNTVCFDVVDLLNGEGGLLASRILSIGGVQLNLNSTVTLSLILVSGTVLLSRISFRGFKTISAPFASFLFVFLLVWVIRAPTSQGLRTMVLISAPIVFASVLYVNIRSYRDIVYMEKAIIYSVPVAVAFALFLHFAGLRSAWGTTWVNHVSRFMGAGIAAQTAIISLPGLALLLGRLKTDQRPFWPGIAFLTATIALTVSRMAFAVAMVMFFATMVSSKRGRVVKITVGVIVVLLLLMVFGGKFINRSSSHNSADEINTSGRSDMWKYYTKLALRKPWLGYGLGEDILQHNTARGAEDKNATRLLVPHNDYLRLWFSLGVVGLCAYIYAYIKMVGRTRGKRNNHFSLKMKWAMMLSLLAHLLMSMTDNCVANFNFNVQLMCIITMAIRARELESPALGPDRAKYA